MMPSFFPNAVCTQYYALVLRSAQTEMGKEQKGFISLSKALL